MSKWKVTIEVDDPDDLNANDVRDSVEDAINKDTYMRAGRVTVEPLEEKAYVRRVA
jgi:hypothetical protein